MEIDKIIYYKPFINNTEYQFFVFNLFIKHSQIIEKKSY